LHSLLRRAMPYYDPPKILFAFALIFAALLEESFPRFTICVARALAFAACERSGIGYLRFPGSPNVLAFNLFRAAACSFAITAPYHHCYSRN